MAGPPKIVSSALVHTYIYTHKYKVLCHKQTLNFAHLVLILKLNPYGQLK